jgi:hypothetical protein
MKWAENATDIDTDWLMIAEQSRHAHCLRLHALSGAEKIPSNIGAVWHGSRNVRNKFPAQQRAKRLAYFKQSYGPY